MPFSQKLHHTLSSFTDVSEFFHSRYDLIHSFGERRLHIARNSRLVLSVQDMIPITLSEGSSEFIAEVRARLTSLVRQATVIITISEFSKREICKTLNVPEEKIVIIPNGLDHDWFNLCDPKSLSASKQRISQLKISPPYIAYFGGTTQRKNLNRLITAFGRLTAKPDFQYDLILVGQPLPSDSSALIQKLGITERVRSLGYLSPVDALSVLRCAEATVYPSTYEGFGMPPLESIACGIPVAASNASSLPEVLGDAPVYFDPLEPESIEQAVTDVLFDDDVRKRCTDRGVAQASTYTWSSNASKTICIYDDVIQQIS